MNEEEDDDNMIPNTPVIKDDTRRGKEDPNEFLLGDDDFNDDEGDVDASEEYHED